MVRKKQYYFIFFLFLLLAGNAVAQGPVVVSVKDSIQPPKIQEINVGEIVLLGNRKTKPQIILREIPFKTGDHYPLEVLIKKMETAKKQLMNTTLFHTVIVYAKKIEDERIDIAVEVSERWYLFPLPFFKPVDRNLNQWLVEQKGSLDRVNYGAKLAYYNATGRNDKLRIGFTNGYTKQVMLSYDRPFIDKRLKWGLKFGVATGKNREINYNTVGDKQLFFKDQNNYIRSFTTSSVEFTYRRAIKTKHIFGIGYTKEEITDTITKLNPYYFKSGRKAISFPSVYYTLNYLNLDYNPYPTKGYTAIVTLAKTGMNNVINVWQLHAKGLGIWPVSKHSFFSLSVFGGIKLPFNQPYFTRRFLGYGDIFMQGYEYNVVDGVAGGYVKTTLTRELFNFNFRTPAGKKKRDQQNIPFRIFGKIYGNAGYVHNPQPGDNTLSNRMLYSGGFGIDIVTFYDVNFKLEWTFNSMGRNGIYFHQNSIF